MRPASILAMLLACLWGSGCAAPAQPQVISLLGEELHAMKLDAGEERKRRSQLAEAEAAYRADPWDETNIIWLGRRQAYLGWYDRSIDTFREGLRIHPGSSRLLRHRGHRFITTRRFDLALADLERAAALIEGVPDEIEPDGMPNARNEPRSTNHTNIQYHLGLGRYVTGDFERAAAAYRRCLEHSTNDDMTVATLYWLYLALRRAGHDEEAAAVLAPVRAEMDIIENDEYHRLLLLFKGDIGPDDVIDPAEPDAIQSTTAAYGLANWHAFAGDSAAADALLEDIVRGPAWPAFGHIAAEADLARARAAAADAQHTR